jgi:hypothetical protein
MRSYGEELGIKGFEHFDPAIQRVILAEKLKSPKPAVPLTVKDISSFFQNVGYDRDMLSQLSLDEWEAITNRANALAPQVGREQALLMAAKEFQGGTPQATGEGGSQRATEEPPARQELPGFLDLLGATDYYKNRNRGQQEAVAAEPQQQGEGFFSPFFKGMESSISGRAPAILRGEPVEEYEKRTSLGPEATFAQRLLHSGGKLAGDLPYYGAGGTLGAQAGGAAGSLAGPFGAGAGAIVGGSAGALAMQGALNQALTEYHRWQSKGFEGSFEDFIHAANRSTQAGIEGAIEGGTLSILGEAIPALKALSPEIKKLLEKPKVPERALKGVFEATGLLASKTVGKGELPSTEEIVDVFAQLVGINIGTKLPGSLRKIEDTVKRFGAKPETLAREIAHEMMTREIEPTNLKEVERVITDVTKSYAGPEREAARSVVESLQGLKAPEPRKTAEALAERPIEETLEGERKAQEKKARPLTEKEQAKRQNAKEGADKLQLLIDKTQGDITALEQAVADPKVKDRKLYEAGLRSKQEELADLQKKHRNLMSIAEKGVEPFSKEALQEPIAKHMVELEEFARNPEGATAKEWEAMFARDQKYVDEFAKTLQKGQLPEAPYRDRYVKLLDTYMEAYENLNKSLEQSIAEKAAAIEALSKRSKAYKSANQELGYLKHHLDLLKRNEKINRSKTGLQLDKIAQLYALNKAPTAALTKQILKGLRSDIPELQKEFVTAKKKLDALEKRSTALFDQQVKALDQMLADYRKKPSDILLKRLADEAGVDVSDLKKARVEGKQMAEEMVKDVANDVPKDEAVETLVKKLKGFYSKNPVAQAAVWAIISTELQNALKALTGLNIPIYTVTSTLRGFIPKDRLEGTLAGFATYGLASVYKQLKDNYDEWDKRAEYRKLKTGSAKADFVKQLKKEGYSPADIKSIVR